MDKEAAEDGVGGVEVAQGVTRAPRGPARLRTYVSWSSASRKAAREVTPSLGKSW